MLVYFSPLSLLSTFHSHTPSLTVFLSSNWYYLTNRGSFSCQRLGLEHPHSHFLLTSPIFYDSRPQVNKILSTSSSLSLLIVRLAVERSFVSLVITEILLLLSSTRHSSTFDFCNFLHYASKILFTFRQNFNDIFKSNYFMSCFFVYVFSNLLWHSVYLSLSIVVLISGMDSFILLFIYLY